MTDKELRRLKRSELMELLLMQSRALDEYKTEIATLKEQLNDRKLEQEDVGSIAEASLKLNHVFEAAQAAADQYLANISVMENRCRDMEAETYKKCGDREREAQERCTALERKCEEMEKSSKEKCEAMEHKCEEMEKSAKEKCEEMEKNTKEQCEAILEKAKGEAAKLLDDAEKLLEEAKGGFKQENETDSREAAGGDGEREKSRAER